MTAAWTHFLAVEKTVMSADADCRADAYVAGTKLLGPALDEFSASHAADLQRVRADWQDMVNRAEGLGWDPTALEQTVE